MKSLTLLQNITALCNGMGITRRKKQRHTSFCAQNNSHKDWLQQTVGCLHRDASKTSQVSTLLIAMLTPAQQSFVSETLLVSDACVL